MNAPIIVAPIPPLTSTSFASAVTASAAQILRLNRDAAGSAQPRGGTLVLTYRQSGQGLSGVASRIIDVQSGWYLQTLDAGPLHQRSGFDGAHAWSTDLSGAVTSVTTGDAKRLAISRAYINANVWWRPGYGGASIAEIGAGIVEGRVCDRLSVTPSDGAPFQACFDRETHRLTEIVEPHAFQPVTITFGKFRSSAVGLVAAKRVSDDGSGPSFAESQRLDTARVDPPRRSSAFGPPVSPVDFVIEGPSGKTTVPFRFIGSHIYADVMLNHRGPFTFLFDTGAEDTLSPTTAKALGVPVVGTSPVGGAGAGVESAGYATAVTLTLGGLELHNQTVHVLPVTDKAKTGFEVDGVIGAELSHRVVARFDYRAQTMTFIVPSRFDSAASGSPVAFNFYDAVPVVQAKFDGLSTRFIIDTGNGGELDLTSPFVTRHGLIAKYPIGLMAGNLGGIGGGIRFYVTHARSIHLGEVKISNVLARMSLQKSGALAADDIGGDIGSGLLRRFTVTFDYGYQIMFLKPQNGPTPGAAGYDESGLTLEAPPGGITVVSVLPNSPAALAGLKTGDVVVAVDGKAIRPSDLLALREKFILKPSGTRVEVTIQRGLSTTIRSIKLRDLITRAPAGK